MVMYIKIGRENTSFGSVRACCSFLACHLQKSGRCLVGGLLYRIESFLPTTRQQKCVQWSLPKAPECCFKRSSGQRPSDNSVSIWKCMFNWSTSLEKLLIRKTFILYAGN